jgi:capsular polysaccharide biosynthesis protein
MENITELESEILKVLSHDFHGVKLLRVKISPEHDHEGDEILRVEVVFAGEPKDIEPIYMTKAIRSVIPKLNEMNILAFPSMSFISAKDAQITAS